MKKHFDNEILCVSNHSQPLSAGWNGAIVYDQKCPRVQSSRRRTFWWRVVNFELINNKNSTVIKLETFTVNVICQLQLKCRVIQKDGLNWRVNGTSTHTRQLDAVFQVLCSLCGLTCVGYAQNSLAFVSPSPLIHVVGRSFCLYTDSLFAQIGDSNGKCSSSLEVECWN